MIPAQAILEKLEYLRRNDPDFHLFGSSPENGWGHGYIMEPVVSESTVLAFEQAVGVCLPDNFRDFVTQVCNGGPGPGYGFFGFPTNWEDFLNKYRTPFDDTNDEMNGCLVLCHHGCCIYEYLVVNPTNPKNYGQLVTDQGFGEVLIGGDFLSDYIGWLDSAVAQVTNWHNKI